MAKPRPKPAKRGREKNALAVREVPGEDPEVTMARQVIRPSVQAAATIQAYERGNDIHALIEVLREQIDAVRRGDLSRPEEMLLAQAHTLDSLFGWLSRRAQSAEYVKVFESYLKLALRAQSQCRSTLEALSEMKQPRPVAVWQANIAGHQQITNVASTSRAGEIENTQSKLLEKTDGKRLDTGATNAASGADTPHEAVVESHRARKR